MGEYMQSEVSIIEGQYCRDILNQPHAVRETLAALTVDEGVQAIGRRLRRGSFDRIVLTGMGSSFFALFPINLHLGQMGNTSLMLETSELIHYNTHFLTPRTLILAVSQSGRSVEIVRLLERNRKQATILGVTNTEASPLAHESDAVVMTRAGEEFSVSCKTYVTALMALHWLAALLGGEDLGETRNELEGVAPALDRYLSPWKTHVMRIAGRLRKMRHLFLVGRGSSLAAAGTGALIIKESDHFHAEGMSSAAFRHGPFEMLNDETFVLVFGGDDRTKSLNLGLLRDLNHIAVSCAYAGEEAVDEEFRLPPLPPAVRPILEILPVEMITLALATCANREAGRFEHASKVTTVE